MSKPVTAATPHQILAKAGPYPLPAYQDDGLGGGPVTEHVSGQQLCMGLRDYAIEQFGMLARPVLEGWSIRRTDDFGRMVFAMIEAGAMSKTPQDTPDDFNGVYDFDEAFAREHVAVSMRAAGA